MAITYFPGGVSLARPSASILVYRLLGVGGGITYEYLSNIRCLGIRKSEGADPGAARFRYTFMDYSLDPSDPQRFEQVYPVDAVGPGIVQTDDQIVVFAVRDDGYTEMLHHGFALVPQVDLNAETETVSFSTLGAMVRMWDYPLPGAWVRDAVSPFIVSDIQTDIPVRFNPDGKPNATDVTADSGGGDASTLYPVFIGPVWPLNKIAGAGFSIRHWTLAMACKYVVAVGLQKNYWADPSVYIQPYDLSQFDGFLKAIVPTGSDDGVINTNDPTTFALKDIEVPDIDVTGEAWPLALERLIEPHGFGMRFNLSVDSAFLPIWNLVLYRKDNASLTKELNLQVAGNAFDPSQTNLGDLALARDIHGIANTIYVDAAPIRVEASFILAPGFPILAADATTPNAFVATDQDDTTATALKYRRYIFDEIGLGHWDKGSLATVTTPGDFKSILTQGAKKRPYANRLRPGISTLISVDSDGKPLHAQLFVSANYMGVQPGVWDGTGNWQKVDSGEWRLLEDRLGIHITANDPNSWAIGVVATSSQFPDGKINLVEACAAPTVAKPYPTIMLVCCVDSDQDFNVVASKRISSPTKFVVSRRVDARDRFRKRIVSQWSFFNLDELGFVGGVDTVVSDDTADAQQFADATRRSMESGTFTGTAVIPRLTTAYEIGDKIRGISGRNVSLRTNAGAEASESAIYPSIVGINWDFDGKQITQIELSQHSLPPPPKRSKGYQE